MVLVKATVAVPLAGVFIIAVVAVAASQKFSDKTKSSSSALSNTVPSATVPSSDSTSSLYALYNLAEDPTEINNLYDQTAVKDGQTYFDFQREYYAGLIQAASIPVLDDMFESWKAGGGLMPWVETKLKSGPIGKKYTNSDAPHIVFMLVDDWGWNDIGYHSSYMSWTTPNIDQLAANGIKLENHYSHELCSPTRGALLTGRYAIRLGLGGLDAPSGLGAVAELPLTETTLAQELKSAGYETYMVGKWDLGFSTSMHSPLSRGFDKFYGYYSDSVDYWTKEHDGYLDLQNGDHLETDPKATDSTYHNAYLMQDKAEAFIDYHADTYPYKPMFLYYSTQLVHGPWRAPSTYTDRCGVPWKIADSTAQYDTQNYCALNLMLDEIVANITCKLKAKQMAEDTILVIVSDNGGERTIAGNSYPYKGHKGSYQNGGVKTTAIIHSALVESNKRGSSYTGTMHVTDWLPTLMGVATNGAWEGSLSGADLDGVDLWSAIATTKNTVQHDEIPFYVAPDGSAAVIQRGDFKYFFNVPDDTADAPLYAFEIDLRPDHAYKSCASIIMTGEDVHPKETDPTLEAYRQTVRGETGQGFLDVVAADVPKAGTAVISPPVTAKSGGSSAASDSSTVGDVLVSSSSSSGSDNGSNSGSDSGSAGSSTSGGSRSEESTDAPSTAQASGPTAQKAATTASSAAVQGAKATAANQATATAPIARHTGTTALYKKGGLGLSPLVMTAIVASVTAVFMTLHVVIRNRFLGADEGGMKSGLQGLGETASRGRYSQLSNAEV